MTATSRDAAKRHRPRLLDCSLCQDEEDFLNCPHCNGTSCTGDCDDYEGVW